MALWITNCENQKYGIGKARYLIISTLALDLAMHQQSTFNNNHRILVSLWATVVILILLGLSSVSYSAQSLPGAEDPLSPEDAFVASVQLIESNTITLHFDIADGYYLYRDKLSFSLYDDASKLDKPNLSEAMLLRPVFATALAIDDEYFGKQFVHRNSSDIVLPYTSKSDLYDGVLAVNFQGCADMGLCYPLTTTLLRISLPASFDGTSSVKVSGAIDTQLPPDQSEQDRLYTMLGSSSIWFNVFTFFGLGLLLAFTPCVLPMIPILSSLIVGQGESMSTGRAFHLSMVYVFVMASTYAVVGIVVGLSGYNVQAFLQNPWVLSAIALLFVILSLSMFGFYELQMPASLQTRLTQWSNKKGGGQVSGVAAMGFVSTLIVGPCVTAPLAGALIYIAKTGDAFIGGAALFSLGLGMGVPLLLIGTSAGKFVPKAGVWMNATKQIFGILMLVMAVYMISRILPTAVSMGLYGILAIMSGIYLGATDSVNRDSTGWHRFGKGAGIVVSVYGLALLLGALANGNSYTAPLKSVMSTLNTSDNGVPVHGFVFQSVKGIDGLQQAVKQASAEGRPVMLDFYADWCISCKEMDAFTFSDVQVKTLLKDVLVLQADVTENDMLDQALLKAFALFGPPGIIFYDSNGNEIPAARLVGFMSAANFKKHLTRYVVAKSI
ncbi:MAG: thiol:disulfide interchange protein DsbD [Granulosicoccus sp.]|jgi:thiol:disulfide interchange protein DsbD